MYRQQLVTVIGALRVGLPDRYRWYGNWSPRLPNQIMNDLDEATLRSFLEAQLRSTLYNQFYLHGRATPATGSSGRNAAPAESTFVRALVEANRGAGSWQSGWHVVEAGEGGILVERAGLAIRVRAEDHRPEESTRLGAGSTVSVRLPKGYPTLSPGFYLAQGEEPFAPSPDDTIVRLYWHLTPSGAPELMESITTRLNDARLPFRFKVLNDPNAYRRNDAGVLYIARTHLHRLAEHLPEIYRDIAPYLSPGVPAFAKPMAPSLGLAEDPRDAGSSFGMHRCGLLAEAFIEAAEREVTSAIGVLKLIEERFRLEGLDLDHPYLNPGSADDYDSILVLDRSYVSAAPFSLYAMRTHGEDAPSEDPEPGGPWLEIAATIGVSLVQSAIWHDGRCVWLGRLETENSSDDTGQGTIFGTIGPDVYSGTAGIALFLAELYRQTGDQRFAETARGAIAQAVHHIDDLPDHGRLGLYSGWPGVALTSARLGSRLRDSELLRTIPGSLFDRLDKRPQLDEPDLLAGTAGAILALLELARLTQDERYLSAAIEFGDALFATAKRRRQTMCWPVHTSSGRRALTGFAHGAAGIATALLALFAETTLDRFAEAARAAIAFEQENFSAEHGNWLDLRYPVIGSRFGPAAVVATAWCHGAAGIATSRIAAWKVLGGSDYLDQARTAIDATQRWFESEPLNSVERWKLCHGFPGNADILLIASKFLPDDALHLRRLAEQVGTAALESRSLPTDPGLMLGLAGLGFFYLRLANPSISSPLVPFTLDLS